MSEEFDFNKIGNFDEFGIAIEELAKYTVPMFLIYRRGGLSPEEAAYLTVALLRGLGSTEPPQTLEGNDG